MKNATVWWSAAILIITFSTYLRTANYGFINLDDGLYINCAAVRTGLTADGLKWAFTTLTNGAIWMPLTYISYMVDVSLFGVTPGPMHVENAVFHAVDAVLLFLCILMILRNLESFFFSSPFASVSGSAQLRPPFDTPPCDLRPTTSDLRLSTIAALAALFWSLHPLRVESVAWVASRKDVLSIFWELLAFISWVKAVIADGAKEVSREDTETRDGGRGCAEPPPSESLGDAETPIGDNAPAANHSDLRLLTSDFRSLISALRSQLFRIFALLCFVCACLCKPTAMTFPILAGLLEFLLVRRVRWNHYTVPFLVALAVASIAQYSQTEGGATEALSVVPLYGRLLNAATAFGTYCWETLAPVRLAAAHVHKWPDMPLFLVPGLFICMIYGVGLLILFWRSGGCRLLLDELPASARRFARVSALISDFRSPTSDLARSIFVGLAWFLIAVAPMLGLSSFGFQSHADRFTYLPAIGFSLALASTQMLLGKKAARLFNIVLVVVLGVWLGLTWRQIGYWKNDETLFVRTLLVDPLKNDIAHRNLGRYYSDVEHNLSKAVWHFDQAFQINRARNRNSQIYYILALAENGDLARAKEETRDLDHWSHQHLCKNLTLEVDSTSDPTEAKRVIVPDTFIAYALIAHLENNDDLAQQHLDFVLKMNPRHAEAHYVKGLIAYDNGRYHEAFQHWGVYVETAGLFMRSNIKEALAKCQKK